jgi:hypothetical protein
LALRAKPKNEKEKEKEKTPPQSPPPDDSSSASESGLARGLSGKLAKLVRAVTPKKAKPVPHF